MVNSNGQKKILNTKLFQNVTMVTTIMVTHGNHKIIASRFMESTDQLSKMEIESSPLTLSTSPCEATRIMMLSLALIQSGKTLISAQYPGNSHHAEEKKNYSYLFPIQSNLKAKGLANSPDRLTHRL